VRCWPKAAVDAEGVVAGVEEQEEDRDSVEENVGHGAELLAKDHAKGEGAHEEAHDGESDACLPAQNKEDADDRFHHHDHDRIGVDESIREDGFGKSFRGAASETGKVRQPDQGSSQHVDAQQKAENGEGELPIERVLGRLGRVHQALTETEGARGVKEGRPVWRAGEHARQGGVRGRE